VAVHIPQLRRWFAGAIVALVCLVAAFYLYSRHRVQNALKQVPEKIGFEIQQSASGFTFSKSFKGHTLFKIEAGKLVQFKGGGKGELHDVEITVYGQDSRRFDRITGKDFEYDALTGEVIGKGEVQIDLESNPASFGALDQSIPNGLKNPVHLKTTDLVFNQKTGDAHADGEVDFAVPQANGSALGLTYVARSAVLTLNSKVRVDLNRFPPMSITADRLTLSHEPRMLVLERPRVTEGSEHSEADMATAFLSQDNKLERVLAQGNVLIGSDRLDGGKIAARQLDLRVGADGMLHEATLLGDVHFESLAEGGTKGSAGRTVLHFAKSNVIKNVHADQGVVLTQPATAKSDKQSFELTAPAMDFLVAEGRLIRSAETSGPPRIAVSSAGGAVSNESAVITSGKFTATFDDKGQLATLHGSPDSRIVSKSPGKPDHVSTSQTIDAEFQRGGIAALLQTGGFTYNDGRVKAWADSGRYTPQNQMLLLDGSPRVADGGVTTTARTIRLNRLTGTAYAERNVKTTDISLEPKTGLLFSATPIHVTAESMTATRSPAMARYNGNVRLWQDANSVEAPSIEFQSDRRSVTAERSASQRVSTSLSQIDKQGKIIPVAISADRLTYSQAERTLHFEGSVSAITGGINMAAEKMDCYLQNRTEATENTKDTTSAAVEKIVAAGGVVIREPERRVTGNLLVYTAFDDKFVMTGGPPSIFDAEHGNVTGDSLTLYGHDARVLVEGSKQSPAVTEIRVAR
jgi:lipopolysaccharide export system protein LptA